MDVARTLDAACRLGLGAEDRRLLERCLGDGRVAQDDPEMGELLALLEDPRCNEMQADGVPCGDPTGRCEGCRRAGTALDHLMERVRQRGAGG